MSMPFDAETPDGEVVTADIATPDKEYRCPSCGTDEYELRAMSSERFDVHFYHVSEDCGYETPVHRRMVAVAKAEMERRHGAENVEGEGKTIGQWCPDVVVTGPARIAVECQHKNEDKEAEKDDVITCYQRHGYDVYWMYKEHFDLENMCPKYKGKLSSDKLAAEFYSAPDSISHAVSHAEPFSGYRDHLADNGVTPMRPILPPVFGEKLVRELLDAYHDGLNEYYWNDSNWSGAWVLDPVGAADGYIMWRARRDVYCGLCADVIEAGSEAVYKLGSMEEGHQKWYCEDCFISARGPDL